MPGPSSAMSTRTHGPSRRVEIVRVPRSPSASIALSMRFVHTWLSSEPRTVSCGQRAVVVAHDLDRGVLELVAQHDQRRLQALVDVGRHQPTAVHVGVGLDRGRRGRPSATPSRAARRRGRARSATRPPSAPRRRSPGPRARSTAPARPSSTPAAASGSATRHGSGPRGPRGARASRPRRRRRRARRQRVRCFGARQRLALQRDEPLRRPRARRPPPRTGRSSR